MLFSASFRANGNLLSQWRGYSNHGKGISLGFNPRAIKALADEQDFSLGRCLYNVNEEQALANDIVSIVVSMHAEHPDLQTALDDIEGDLLGICALLKHPRLLRNKSGDWFHPPLCQLRINRFRLEKERPCWSPTIYSTLQRKALLR
jgi:hypothetical protein